MRLFKKKITAEVGDEHRRWSDGNTSIVKVYASEKDFRARADHLPHDISYDDIQKRDRLKGLNGVSIEFLERNNIGLDQLNLFATRGCWNCRDLKGCRDCTDCSRSTRLRSCVGLKWKDGARFNGTSEAVAGSGYGLLDAGFLFLAFSISFAFGSLGYAYALKHGLLETFINLF